MTILPEQISAMIEAELSTISDSRVESHVRRLLVEPTAIMRDWDYGAPDEAHPCWSVLEHSRSNTGIVYCESGFGPRSPWGLVMLPDPSPTSMGMDCGWFGSFMDAYFDSMAVTELPIWRVFKQTSTTYPGSALTNELDWDSAWAEINRLRATDSSVRYHCCQDRWIWPEKS